MGGSTRARLVLWAVLALAAPSCVLSPEIKGPANLQKAEEAFLQERFEAALSLYDLFLSENPSYPERARLLSLVGRCHLGAGRADRALRTFDQAASLRPEGPVRWEIAYHRAAALRRLGDIPRALEAFREVESAPAAERGRAVLNDALYYEHALALFRAGDWRGGHERLAKVDPRGPFGRKVQARAGLTAFFVQVGSFSDEQRALHHMERLKPVSPSGSVRAVGGEDPFFVVCCGPFPLYEAAQREAERLRRLGFGDAFVLP